MQIKSSQQAEHEVQKILSPIALDRTVSAAEIVHALREKEAKPELAMAISTFLDRASADIIISLCIATDSSDTEITSAIDAVVSLASKTLSSRAATLDVELRRVFVPQDFPSQPQPTAIGGAQLKMAFVSYAGKFYEPGTSPPEVLARWEGCEDLAHQFLERCQVTEKGKYAHLNRQQILQQYLERLLLTGWGSDADMKWVIRRVAALLSWEAPSGAMPDCQRGGVSQRDSDI